jgi:hypothetical protein
VLERLDTRQPVVCRDVMKFYYRCGRGIQAIVPRLMGLPIREPGRRVRKSSAATSPAGTAAPPLEPPAEASRPLRLRYEPNLVPQFPGEQMPPEILRLWSNGLQRMGFAPTRYRLVPIDHPKAARR